MTIERIAGVCFWIAVSSAAAAAQQRSGTTDQAAQPPAERVVERSYPSGGLTPSRHVQTRRTVDRREIVNETVEMPGIDGKLKPFLETTSETVRPAPGIVRTTQDLYGLGAERQRILLQRTESEEVTGTGTARSVQSTWIADPNGRFDLRTRQIDETHSVAPNVQRSVTTLLVPGINEALSESKRTEHTERQINPMLVRQDSVQMLRDVNGRWLPRETWIHESRQIGPSDHVEEETIQRPDLSGNLTVSERSVTRRSVANGREDLVIETYTPSAEGFARSTGSMALSHRIRRSTTGTANGGRETIEEEESRSLVSPGDPMRVTRRTLETVRRIGPNRWATERRVFELDSNGRMAPILTETEETVER